MNNLTLFSALGAADDALLARAGGPAGKLYRARTGKALKIALLAAALAVFLSVTAFAVYRFVLPKSLESTLNLASPQIYTVIDTASADAVTLFIENKTVQTAGYTVTFEAVARGVCMNNIYVNGELLHPEKTYAIFTVKPENAADAQGDGMRDLRMGYCVSLKGYAPNPSMFPAELMYQTENGILYAACDVTSALPFADRELTISLADRFAVTPEILRMDENGNAYFVRRFSGLAAQFPLRLPADAADPAKQEKYMQENPCFDPEPDYSAFEAFDEKQNAIDAGEIDYSPYIGENEWRADYKLEFGKVYCADTYLEKRGTWAQPGVRPLTTEELDAVLIPVLSEISTRVYAGGGSDEAVEKEFETAAVSAQAFPEQADRFTLPDGSVCFYLPGNNYLRIRPDGVPCFVAADCLHVIVETVGVGSSTMLRHTAPAVNSGVVMAQLVACYIDGRSPLEAEHRGVSDESVLRMAETDFAVFTCRADAVYSLVTRYASYAGTAEIR